MGNVESLKSCGNAKLRVGHAEPLSLQALLEAWAVDGDLEYERFFMLLG